MLDSTLLITNTTYSHYLHTIDVKYVSANPLIGMQWTTFEYICPLSWLFSS